MKILLIAAVAVSCSGCGALQRTWTGWTGGLTYKCSKVGTTLAQSDSGLVQLLDRKGNTVPCEE